MSPSRQTNVDTENSPMHETWKAMEELVDEGLTTNIGIR